MAKSSISVKLLVMKLLDGLELAGYIKERQAKQVRALRQSWRVNPKLAIIRTGDSPVTDLYLKLKANYGQDILIDVDVYNVKNEELLAKISELNNNQDIHGIIIQLPLSDLSMTEEALNAVSPEKDVDGLGQNSPFTPATPQAINWLLSGYNVVLKNKSIAIVGNGRLVGAPLFKLWVEAGYNVSIYDINTKNLSDVLIKNDVIVTATGVPGLINSSMLKNKAIVVDAGSASENGRIVGDLAEDVRQRPDLILTPARGGVGPLTVSALFDNVILSARKIASAKGQQDL